MSNNEEQNSNFRNKILPFLSAITITLYPMLFLYLSNIVEGKFNEILPYIVFFVLLIFILTLIIGIIFHNFIKVSMCLILLSTLFFNYKIIESGILKLFENLKYWHVLMILLLVVFHLSYILCKKCSNYTLSNIQLLVFIFSTVLIAFNLIMGIPQLINKMEKAKDAKIESKSIDNSSISLGDKNLPNIYYIIMDEQSSSNVMKKYFNYDDSGFNKQLEERGFSVSMDSYNESIWTTIVTANLLSLEYKVTDYTDTPGILSIRKNPKLFEFVKKLGYTITGIDYQRTKDDPDVLPIDVMPDGVNTLTDSLDVLLMKTTPLYIMVMENGDAQAEFIKSSYAYIADDSVQSPRFGYYHVPGGHSPFIFNENGNINPSYLFSLYDNKEVYIGSFKYSQKMVLESIDKILQREKDCIIILQSDHSARLGLSKKIWAKYNVDEKDIRNVMNAVYYKGEPIDEIKGQSGVNTLRIVFNKTFGTNFPVLDVPYVEVPLNE